MARCSIACLIITILMFVSIFSVFGEWELKFRRDDINVDANYVHFITPTQGWAVAGGIVYWTEDGGDTWVPRELDILHQAFFLNALDGWQSIKTVDKLYIEALYPPKGAQIAFERSFDGGLSWIEMNGIVTEVVEINRPPVPEKVPIFRTDGLPMFYFLDFQTGFLAGSSITYGNPDSPDAFGAFYIGKTTDGGNTWTLHIRWGDKGSPGGLTKEIEFLDAQNGWIMTRYPAILYQTTDGGNTWSFELPKPETWGDLASVNFVTPQEGWLSYAAYGVEGIARISHTLDGGKTWQIVIEIIGGLPGSILFINPQEGWATVNGEAQVPILGLKDFFGIIHTIDGGKNWKVDLKASLYKYPDYLLNLIYDPLTKTLWATGSYSSIYKQTEIITGVRPQDKLSSTWGQIKRTRKEE